jgi:hypothetical protein
MMKKWMILGLSLVSFMTLAQQKIQNENRLLLNMKQQSKVEISYQPASYPVDFMLLISDSAGKIVFLENQFRIMQPYSRAIDLGKYKANKYFVQLKDEEGELKRTITLK